VRRVERRYGKQEGEILIQSYYIGGTGSGIKADTKEEFLSYLAEEIDRAEFDGALNFDVQIIIDTERNDNI